MDKPTLPVGNHLAIDAGVLEKSQPIAVISDSHSDVFDLDHDQEAALPPLQSGPEKSLSQIIQSEISDAGTIWYAFGSIKYTVHWGQLELTLSTYDHMKG